MSQLELHPDFNEFLACLSGRKVRFLVVGAHALAVLGAARPTRDFDVLVEPTEVNARRLAGALSDFGFPELAQAAAEHFAQPERMATLGREPVRIDILSSIAAVSFARAWKGRVVLLLNGRRTPFLGLAEMRRVKRAVGRPKDLADLALLDEVRGTGRKRAPKGR